ncbi:hypothetical protein J2Z79_001516 [Symbiobacterium terraclitae]|jgi:hypothetical protein|uniref:Uncharacterized protein n=1 Tax=Symbiobacterium terraclitae TaxID=557451 RepID=A0ABS4JRE8_9FIRM|nr:hypothetical protein [Symbiobacterium terraclitae]MBP2018117.1 hypothetical protein [Symbiobacterium terraclitae]
MDRRPRYRFEQFSATRQILGMHPAPDGESLLFASDISGQHNLWQVPSRGGWPRQLTLFNGCIVPEYDGKSHQGTMSGAEPCHISVRLLNW